MIVLLVIRVKLSQHISENTVPAGEHILVCLHQSLGLVAVIQNYQAKPCVK